MKRTKDRIERLERTAGAPGGCACLGRRVAIVTEADAGAPADAGPCERCGVTPSTLIEVVLKAGPAGGSVDPADIVAGTGTPQ